jgi:hypothetical protein
MNGSTGPSGTGDGDRILDRLLTSTEGRGAIGSNPTQPNKRPDDDTTLTGLTPDELQTLAQKVYALMIDEVRLESERHGRTWLR